MWAGVVSVGRTHLGGRAGGGARGGNVGSSGLGQEHGTGVAWPGVSWSVGRGTRLLFEDEAEARKEAITRRFGGGRPYSSARCV